MTSLFSYLLTFFGIAFWFFRAIATLMYQLDMEFFTKPINLTYEIIVLFSTLPCILLVVKRNIVGAAAYVGIYVTYFGTSLYEAILSAQATGLNIVNSSDMLCTVVDIRGDYAYLKYDETGVVSEVAIGLLPFGIDIGDRLKFEDFEFTKI